MFPLIANSSDAQRFFFGWRPNWGRLAWRKSCFGEKSRLETRASFARIPDCDGVLLRNFSSKTYRAAQKGERKATSTGGGGEVAQRGGKSCFGEKLLMETMIIQGRFQLLLSCFLGMSQCAETVASMWPQMNQCAKQNAFKNEWCGLRFAIEEDTRPMPTHRQNALLRDWASWGIGWPSRASTCREPGRRSGFQSAMTCIYSDAK